MNFWIHLYLLILQGKQYFFLFFFGSKINMFLLAFLQLF